VPCFVLGAPDPSVNNGNCYLIYSELYNQVYAVHYILWHTQKPLHPLPPSKVREDGKIDVCLRDPGGKGKAESVGKAILDKLQTQPGGLLHVGDKSSPEEINAAFPGVSKSAFKKAVAALYKKKLVQPGPTSIELMSKK